MYLAYDRNISPASDSPVEVHGAAREEVAEHAATSMADVVFPVRRAAGSPRLMYRTFLVGPSRRFEFKKPFLLQFEDCEFGIVARHPKLNCEGAGSSVHEAMEAFCEMFEVQWNALVEVPAEHLTLGGSRARAAFLDIAKVVPFAE